MELARDERLHLRGSETVEDEQDSDDDSGCDEEGFNFIKHMRELSEWAGSPWWDQCKKKTKSAFCVLVKFRLTIL